jgi:hypothetical protein
MRMQRWSCDPPLLEVRMEEVFVARFGKVCFGSAGGVQETK